MAICSVCYIQVEHLLSKQTMSFRKKIFLGIAVFFLSLCLGIGKANHALAAATKPQVDDCVGSLNFVDIAHISCKMSGKDGLVIFLDRNPTDNNGTGGAQNYKVTTSDTFCTAQDSDGNNKSGEVTLKSTHNLKIDDANNSFKAYGIMNYVKSGQSGCTFFTFFNADVGSSSNIPIFLQGGDNSAASLDGVDSGSLSGLSYSRYGGHDPSNGRFLFGDSLDLGSCKGSIIAVTKDGKKAHEYRLSKGGDPFSKYPDLDNMPKDTGCGVDRINYGLGNGDFRISPAITNISANDAGGDGSGGSGGGGTNPADNSETCEGRSVGFAEAWLLCPLLNAANDLARTIVNQFEEQLSFTLPQNDPNCDPNQPDQATGTSVSACGYVGLHRAWNIFRIIASSLLIIVLLVMVISEAVGGIASIDPYTIRKMMPRLVAAVILIQLSWPIFTWVVNAVDALARQLADIMYLPFGGPDNMNLGSLMARAGIEPLQAGGFSWILLIGVVIGAAVALPSVLVFTATAIIAAFVAFFVLVFRKILIILALILAPLALVAWILPGTQQYWKFWWSNFIKALMMFPLVVALVAAGRIFAYVSASSSNGTLIAFLLVLIGFFGPLFLLPKTFKWGGALMSSISNASFQGSGKISGAVAPQVKGFTERNVTGRFAKRYDPNQGRASRTLNSILGGRIIPSRYQKALLAQRGDKWQEEQDAVANALLTRKGEKVQEEGYETYLRNKETGSYQRYKRAAAGAGGKYVKKASLGGGVTDHQEEAETEDVAFKEQAETKMMYGVPAMKQMWVDLMEEGETKHERKMAARKLRQTQSWPEMQTSFTKSGRRPGELEGWDTAIATSPEDYAATLRSRVDLAPHIKNIGAQALRIENEKRTKTGAALLTGRAADDFAARRRMEYAFEDQMSNEDFATQSEGFWQEAARLAQMPGGDQIASKLAARLAAIRDIGGTGPQQYIGHLVGGGIEERVNEVLAAGGHGSVRDYL